MTDVFQRVVMPVADPEDAETTARAFQEYAPDCEQVVAVHVIEKAGGAPDKASVEQREEYAAEQFEHVHEQLDDLTDVDTEVLYGTDVAEAIFAAAGDHEATSIVMNPRGGSRFLQLLTGDVALDLITETDRPVIVLPDGSTDDE